MCYNFLLLCSIENKDIDNSDKDFYIINYKKNKVKARPRIYIKNYHKKSIKPSRYWCDLNI